MDLKRYIRNIPDFPVKGIIFRDITPLLSSPEAFRKSIDLMAERIKKWDFDAIASPEARGFIFGSTLAYLLSKAFIPIRKPSKLPYKTVGIEYELEYGKAILEMHEDALEHHRKVVIVDDVLATGGTVEAISELLKKANGEVVGMAFLIELTPLKARERLKNFQIESLITY
ncbi:MAG TPA: adenine phosphoribosyltransferase [Thermotogaceae bacterium]|nr:adenine phosphoribosyltransferase [Thermotogota bacterium]HEW92259.1 adenine phosphoribosyltransferase [Thermotogaceae bacterium]